MIDFSEGSYGSSLSYVNEYSGSRQSKVMKWKVKLNLAANEIKL